MSYDSQTNILNRHDFDTSFTAEYDNDQTDANLITPTSGTLLKVTGVYISTEGASNAGEKIRLEFSTTGNTVCTFFPKTTPDTFDLDNVMVKGARNESLQITSDLGTGQNYFIAINYKEE